LDSKAQIQFAQQEMPSVLNKSLSKEELKKEPGSSISFIKQLDKESVQNLKFQLDKNKSVQGNDVLGELDHFLLRHCRDVPVP